VPHPKTHSLSLAVLTLDVHDARSVACGHGSGRWVVVAGSEACEDNGWAYETMRPFVYILDLDKCHIDEMETHPPLQNLHPPLPENEFQRRQVLTLTLTLTLLTLTLTLT